MVTEQSRRCVGPRGRCFNEEIINTIAGYNHRRGMSNNAVGAYRNNQKPISRFIAQDLRDADINISLGFARWLARRKHWRHVARHHSSKFY